jgi:F-box protein 21
MEVSKAEGESMFLDPFASDDEISYEELRERMAPYQYSSSDIKRARRSPVATIVRRVGLNINCSAASGAAVAQTLRIGRLRSGEADYNLCLAEYAAAWAGLLARDVTDPAWGNDMRMFLNRLVMDWHEDAWIVYKYLLPIWNKFLAIHGLLEPIEGWDSPVAIMTMIVNIDRRQPIINRRYTQDILDNVKYRVGQVFRHRRYHYMGIITGWSTTGQFDTGPPYLIRETNDLAPDRVPEEDVDTTVAGSQSGNSNGPRSRSNVHYTCL